MITKNQLIDAFLSGFNDIEQMGRFNPNLETPFPQQLNKMFGFVPGQDTIVSVIDRPGTKRFVYIYNSPLHIPNLGNVHEDVLLNLGPQASEGLVETQIFLYELEL